MKNFFFVAGCARSGTSALAQLLSGSPDIVVGMERFGHLVKGDDFRLKPEHFKKERFFDVLEGDTFYSDFDSFHGFDSEIKEKFDTCKLIGDKRPDLYESYDALFSAFPSAKMLFIYRDVESVASSYKGRVLSGENWPASKDFSAAVNEWNRSLFLTREALRKGYDIACVDYDTVFLSEVSLKSIFDYLSVDYCQDVVRKVAEIRQRAKVVAAEKKMLLSPQEVDFVSSNAKKFLIDDVSPFNILN